MVSPFVFDGLAIDHRVAGRLIAQAVSRFAWRPIVRRRDRLSLGVTSLTRFSASARLNPDLADPTLATYARSAGLTSLPLRKVLVNSRTTSACESSPLVIRSQQRVDVPAHRR